MHARDPAGARFHLCHRAGRQHRRQPGREGHADAVRDRQPAFVPGGRRSARPGAARQRRFAGHRRRPRAAAAAPAAGAPSRTRLVRLVREWLGIEGIAEIDKDSNVYPSFAAHHNAMAAESGQLHRRAARQRRRCAAGSAGRDWTIIDSTNGATSDEINCYYTGYYGLGAAEAARDESDSWLTGATGGTRVGILNRGAFLSRFATATGSHPVPRGVAVMRRIACLDLPDPAELDITVIPPVPDPSTPKTTRALYDAHATDAQCDNLSPDDRQLRLRFEQYDGMGAFRANRQETVKRPRALSCCPSTARPPSRAPAPTSTAFTQTATPWRAPCPPAPPCALLHGAPDVPRVDRTR